MPGRPSQKPDIERQDRNTAVTRSPGLSRALTAPKRHESNAFRVARGFLIQPLSERPLEGIWPNSPRTPEWVVQVGDEKEDECNRTR